MLLNLTTVEFHVRVGKYIPLFHMNVNTYPCPYTDPGLCDFC